MSRVALLARLITSISKQLGAYRLGRLLHEVRACDKALFDGMLEQLLIYEWPDRALREGFLRKYLGDHESKLLAKVVLNHSEICALIDQIPSETTPAERRLLYMLFRDLWDGSGNVFEVGPFLGGTTRSIAMGMECNPRRNSTSRVYTADKFSDYYDSDALKRFLKPMFELGTLNEDDRAAIGARGEFRSIFERIHQRHSYWELIKVMDAVLPDLPNALPSGRTILDMRSLSPVSAFFIDGCKSWYATKYFLRQASTSSDITAWYIFQDYGMFTCFWIPLCIYLLRDHFHLVMYTDCTYAWKTTDRPTSDQIDESIPDRFEDLDRNVIETAFDRLVEGALKRGDRRAALVHRLQEAAAWAYRGDAQRAKEIYRRAGESEYAFGYEAVVSAARASPTYKPHPSGNGWVQVRLDEAQ